MLDTFDQFVADRIDRLLRFATALTCDPHLESRLADALAAVDGKVRTDPDLDLLGLAVDLGKAKALHIGAIPMADTNFQTPDNTLAIEVDPAEVKAFVAAQPGTPPVTDDVPCVW